MAHVYKQCTAKTCDPCTGDDCSACGGTRLTRCTGCRAEGLDCWYDSLAFCAVCDGMEGSLLPYCPGVKLSYEQHQINYEHYCAHTGPFASPTPEHLTEARVYAERYVLEHDSIGARRFYDAVRELANGPRN